MAKLPQTILTASDDLQWLREAHLSGVPCESFAVAILHGNADSPERIELYQANRIDIRPTYVYVLDCDGDYQREA